MSQYANAEPETDGFRLIAEAEPLTDFVDALDALVDEIKLQVSPGGIRARAVDPANVACCQVDLSPDAFAEYDADGGELIGLNLARLDDVLGFADDDDLVMLDLDKETRKLNIQVEGLDYTLALIDPDMIRQDPEIPDLELGTDVVMEGRDLSRGVDAADMASDHVRLLGDPDADSVEMRAEGDKDDAALELNRDDLTPNSEIADTEGLYSLDYLKDLRKPVPADTPVRLRFGTDVPLKLNYEYADGAGDVLFMLAPRLEKN